MIMAQLAQVHPPSSIALHSLDMFHSAKIVIFAWDDKSAVTSIFYSPGAFLIFECIYYSIRSIKLSYHIASIRVSSHIASIRVCDRYCTSAIHFVMSIYSYIYPSFVFDRIPFVSLHLSTIIMMNISIVVANYCSFLFDS